MTSPATIRLPRRRPRSTVEPMPPGVPTVAFPGEPIREAHIEVPGRGTVVLTLPPGTILPILKAEFIPGPGTADSPWMFPAG